MDSRKLSRCEVERHEKIQAITDHCRAFAIVKAKSDFVIRAAKLNRTVISDDGEKISLTDAIVDQTVKALGSYELNLRSRPGVKARKAKIQVSSTSVTFVRPAISSAWAKKCGVTRLLAMKYIGRNQPNARAATHVPRSWLRCLKAARPKVKLTDMTVYSFFREFVQPLLWFR